MNNLTADGSRFPARVRDFLETALLMSAFVAGLTGLLFGLRYESFNPLVGTFSARYLLAGLVPAVALLVATCGFLLRPSLRRIVPVAGNRVARTIIKGSAVAIVVVTVLWASSVPESRLALGLVIAVLALGSLMLSRALVRPQLVLCILPIVAVGTLFLIVEAPLLLRPTPVRWGDDRLFAFMHPTRPPFLGPGGRLRAGVDRDQLSAEFPGGAEVVTNSDGFRNRREFAGPPGGETRVLSLGDSFSTGYAMPQDQFFGSQLERAARDLMPSRNIVVLNAEVSNPAHGLFYLQEYGLRYRPKVVLFGLSGNDLVQTEHFFGPRALFFETSEGVLIENPDFDRKRPSPIIRYRDFAYPVVAVSPQRPGLAVIRRAQERWLTHLDGLSVLSWFRSRSAMNPRPVPMYSYAEDLESEDGRKRLIDGLADLGLYYPAGANDIEPLYEQFFAVLEGLRRVTEAAGARFILVIFPQRFQLQPPDWQVMCERWSLDPSHFDLTLLNRRIRAYCTEAGIRCVDLLGPMGNGAAGQGLYLPGGDMHFNSTGCLLAAEMTAVAVEQVLSEASPAVRHLDDGHDSR